MPFKSQAQRRKFAELLVKGEISPETFEEWSRETGSAKLPERVTPKNPRKSGAKKRSTKTRVTTKKSSAKKTGLKTSSRSSTSARRKQKAKSSR